MTKTTTTKTAQNPRDGDNKITVMEAILAGPPLVIGFDYSDPSDDSLRIDMNDPGFRFERVEADDLKAQ